MVALNSRAWLCLIVLLSVLTFALPTPAAAQVLTICTDTSANAYDGYFYVDVGVHSGETRHYDFGIATNVVPFGTVLYVRISFRLADFGQDFYNTRQIQLYSVKYRTNTATGSASYFEARTSLIPYTTAGAPLRATDHTFSVNSSGYSAYWTDTYPELPFAETFTVAHLLSTTAGVNDLSIDEICIRPINPPTATPQASVTALNTRTPTVTRTPTNTKTPTITPTNFTPSATLPPTDTRTPNGTFTAAAEIGTVTTGDFVTVVAAEYCGEEFNPCGPPRFVPPSFPTLALSSPTQIGTATSYVTSTPGTVTPGTGTAILPTVNPNALTQVAMEVDAAGTMGSTGLVDTEGNDVDLYNSANQIGSALGGFFGIISGLRNIELGYTWGVIAFLLLCLGFMISVRLFLFALTVIGWIINFFAGILRILL